jgi:hypothetical protein
MKPFSMAWPPLEVWQPSTHLQLAIIGPGADKLNGASGTDTTPDFNASEGDKRTNVP